MLNYCVRNCVWLMYFALFKVSNTRNSLYYTWLLYFHVIFTIFVKLVKTNDNVNELIHSHCFYSTVVTFLSQLLILCISSKCGGQASSSII